MYKLLSGPVPCYYYFTSYMYIRLLCVWMWCCCNKYLALVIVVHYYTNIILSGISKSAPGYQYSEGGKPKFH